MSVALYATIWIALVFFAAGEAGKRSREDRAGWPWRLWIAGALLAAIHVPIALAVRHDWSHDLAVIATSERTADVYGVAWGGGVYVNYVFIALWLAEALWWRQTPLAYAARSPWSRWTTRAIYAVVIVNAAIVFASPWGRAAGVAVMATLLWAWRPALAGR